MDYQNLFFKVREASRAFVGQDKVDGLLRYLADSLERDSKELLKANKMDLDRIADTLMYNRLKLSIEDIADIAADIRAVAISASPVGTVLERHLHPNGLEISKITTPVGIVGVVCDARPNLSFDMFSMCIKTGNACVLKGCSEALHTCRAAVEIMQKALQLHDMNAAMITLLPPDTEAITKLSENADLVIPLLETGNNIVHVYFDETGNREQAMEIINNSKTRRNALDCLIVHSSRLHELSLVFNPLSDARITIFADERSIRALRGRYPADLLKPADENSFGKELYNFKMAVKTVDSIEEALEHISRHGARHCEAIMSQSDANIEMFLNRVDAAKIYVNASTSFCDCKIFGLGTELEKLHARRPIGLNELTSYRWIVKGQV